MGLFEKFTRRSQPSAPAVESGEGGAASDNPNQQEAIARALASMREEGISAGVPYISRSQAQPALKQSGEEGAPGMRIMPGIRNAVDATDAVQIQDTDASASEASAQPVSKVAFSAIPHITDSDQQSHASVTTAGVASDKVASPGTSPEVAPLTDRVERARHDAVMAEQDIQATLDAIARAGGPANSTSAPGDTTATEAPVRPESRIHFVKTTHDEMPSQPAVRQTPPQPSAPRSRLTIAGVSGAIPPTTPADAGSASIAGGTVAEAPGPQVHEQERVVPDQESEHTQAPETPGQSEQKEQPKKVYGILHPAMPTGAPDQKPHEDDGAHAIRVMQDAQIPEVPMDGGDAEDANDAFERMSVEEVVRVLLEKAGVPPEKRDRLYEFIFKLLQPRDATVQSAAVHEQEAGVHASADAAITAMTPGTRLGLERTPRFESAPPAQRAVEVAEAMKESALAGAPEAVRGAVTKSVEKARKKGNMKAIAAALVGFAQGTIFTASMASADVLVGGLAVGTGVGVVVGGGLLVAALGRKVLGLKKRT